MFLEKFIGTEKFLDKFICMEIGRKFYKEIFFKRLLNAPLKHESALSTEEQCISIFSSAAGPVNSFCK